MTETPADIYIPQGEGFFHSHLCYPRVRWVDDRPTDGALIYIRGWDATSPSPCLFRATPEGAESVDAFEDARGHSRVVLRNPVLSTWSYASISQARAYEKDGAHPAASSKNYPKAGVTWTPLSEGTPPWTPVRIKGIRGSWYIKESYNLGFVASRPLEGASDSPVEFRVTSEAEWTHVR